MILPIAFLAFYLLLVGMAAGWLAWIVLGKSKALSKGRKQPNWPLLLGLGIVGSFVGGLAMNLLTNEGLKLTPSGMIASAVGAIAVAAIYQWFEGRKS
jgi:uncharacterized membrane protein YeaQ/YmgE (transglycosylase-associated protein family)